MNFFCPFIHKSQSYGALFCQQIVSPELLVIVAPPELSWAQIIWLTKF